MQRIQSAIDYFSVVVPLWVTSYDRPRDRSFNDFKLEISEFEGQLYLDLFLGWLRTIERVFEYKDIPEGKKVKLVAVKLRKYASIWWSNVVSKRVKKGKAKIRT